MKKMALFYYDGFGEFEVVLTALLFHPQYEIVSLALEKREYRSERGQRFCVDLTLGEVDIDSIDVLVIPGGDPAPLMENQTLKRFIEDVLSRNKKVGGICGGAILLAGFGLLKGKRCTGDTSGVDPNSADAKYFEGTNVSDEQVVVDGNIITAQGQAYAEFAVELARQMGLYAKPEHYPEALKWCKNIR